MHKRFGLWAWLAVAALAGGCQLPTALSAGHGISGRVVDTTGAAVPGISIRAEEGGTSSVTDGSGFYSLSKVPGQVATLDASGNGWVLVPRFAPGLGDGGRALAFSAGTMTGADFLAVAPDKVTIPMVQGSGPRSPLEGQQVSVTGVVTAVTHRVPNVLYDTTLYDGSTYPQLISEDGFYLEAVDGDRSLDPGVSSGIFVYTHDDRFSGGQWVSAVPLDLKEGDLVTVSGVVQEVKPVDRFNNCAGNLTVTRIGSPAASHVQVAGVNQTHAYPSGVLLTYSAPDPSVYPEYRILPWQPANSFLMTDPIKVFQSVEGMVVHVVNPLCSGYTHYNVEGILADGGRKGGAVNEDLNTFWGGMVIKSQDFNPDLLFVDYQSPAWKTFQAIPNSGDTITDSQSQASLRGILEYTADPLYLIHPLEPSVTTISPTAGGAPPTGWSYTVPVQGWGFNGNPAFSSAAKTALAAVDTNGYLPTWRLGTVSANPTPPDPIFTPSWARTVPADTRLTVASYNLETYTAQGKSYAKDVDVARVFVNDLKCPDLIGVVEMGDDNNSVVVYLNQENAYPLNDGVTWAVENFRDLIVQIKALGGPDYDFREVAPSVENSEGGAPGVNIRPGFLFRTDRLRFIDRGVPTNTWATTANPDPATWPVPYPSTTAADLANTGTAFVQGADGSADLLQSPGRFQGPAFKGSRKPLCGEFQFLPNGKKFFFIECHLTSKGGDEPLYGFHQPPSLSSEARRAQQTAQLNAFVRSLYAIEPQARLILAGDMNDFQFSYPLRGLDGKETGDQILFSPFEEFMPSTEQFSYSYKGNLQQIDHIFLSPRLFQGIQAQGANRWQDVCFISHIDSPFSKNNHIQTTDHDPVTVNLDLGGNL